ncbi:hypothetical protein AVEN_27653-1 [Araneus ventricosus]|uniref:ATP-dependent DNA helicase n=1 Tax=Araneus ventricosus TaxID=182803 RepID=A0A4Y2NLT4_ARAVE|nr:hypothetical protein AVEN_27653-1 [Araneus ventricosus]
MSFEALGRTVCDLRNHNRIMEGVAILLLEDFRRTLSVISRATPEDELNACFKASELWQYVQRKTLTTNVRVHVLGDIPFENNSLAWVVKHFLQNPHQIKILFHLIVVCQYHL